MLFHDFEEKNKKNKEYHTFCIGGVPSLAHPPRLPSLRAWPPCDQTTWGPGIRFSSFSIQIRLENKHFQPWGPGIKFASFSIQIQQLEDKHFQPRGPVIGFGSFSIQIQLGTKQLQLRHLFKMIKNAGGTYHPQAGLLYATPFGTPYGMPYGIWYGSLHCTIS